MRILIVEDELSVAGAMACALEARGHEVVIARSVELALGLPCPEVLVADADLPGLTGLDLLEQYLRGGSTPRTVFVSAAPRLEDCQRAVELGASEFLAKPFRLEELVSAAEGATTAGESGLGEVFAAVPSSLELAQRALAAFALSQGVGPSCRARACTAAGELIQNAIDHAFSGGDGSFLLRATLDGRDLIVEVEDEGRGFDATLSPLEAMADGGGLGRAAALVEDLDITSRPGGGTLCSMRLGAYRVDFDGDRRVDLIEHDFLSPDTVREVLRTIAEPDDEGLLHLSPALAVVVGRLLAGPDPSRLAAKALRS